MKHAIPYVARESTIIERSRGKKVLHLGCVGLTDLEPSERTRRVEESLHYALSEVAEVVGIDYSEEVIAQCQKLGLFRNVVPGNVEKLDQVNIEDTFEIIVAGDIIEHLSNPGLMLEGIKRFCRVDTQLIVTTPHAFGVMNFLRFVLCRFSEGEEHVMTFNLENLSNLLRRHGYVIESVATCYQERARSKGMLFSLGKAFFKCFPKYGGTLFVVARQQPSTQTSTF